MLTVHRAESTSVLADALADVLRSPLPDPMGQEVVAVPARGVERWLAQRLSTVLGAGSGADGICSGISFPSPARLVETALAAAGGGQPEKDPWRRCAWVLLEVLDASLSEPWCAVLARHLGHGPGGPGPVGGAPAGQEHRRGRRWATAAHLAELYGSYAAARPQMLVDWAGGRDTDGAGPLPEDLRWQAELWRRLRERLGPSPAERLEPACALLRERPDLVDLPARFSLFGPTRLSSDALAVLDALAEHRELHLWLPHPSPAMWEAVRGGATGRRRADHPAAAVRHPLLRSLARDVRELQLRLPASADVHHPAAPRPATLLGRLQTDLLADRPPERGRPGQAPAGGAVPADGTVQVHACHGPARQVEVLREVLLRLFEDDPTLEPRDVLVMCPDVEGYAPLVSAAFGLAAGPHPGHVLRVRLADRSLRSTNPLLDTVAALLELAGSRVPASAVLDLAATPAVRRRFDLDDDDLERLRDWVARSGVRWGMDAAARRPYGMGGVPQNTWRAGLDRVLLGVTTAEDEPVWLGLALPLDDVDSGDVDLAGRFAELVDRLALVLDALAGEHPVGHWLRALTDALELLTDTSETDGWQLAQARAELTGAAEGLIGDGPLLQLRDVRALLADRLRGRPTRASFRTGNLTVCTMVPMRSVPHRVVVLLGLDDGVFPRSPGDDGDDVLSREPCLGERDARSEDRQLLLDAVLAAQERLVVLHTGADPVSGATRPPAVPVGELLDALAALTGDRTAVVTRHPLQPYDARCFVGPVPFSFDPVSLSGSRRSQSEREPPAPRERLPERLGPVALADLVAFVEHPVRAYLRQRLRITLPGEDDQVDDALSVALDGLQSWAVGERLLAAALRGVDRADARRMEWLRGTLPPGQLGGAVLDVVADRVDPLLEAGAPLLRAAPQAVDLRVDLGPAAGSRVLSGTLNDVRDGAVITVSYSTLSPRHRLRGYLLALALAAAGEGDRAVTVGRRGNRAITSTMTAPADPRACLGALVALHDRGLREPLPLASRTSAAYAEARLSGNSVEQALDSAGRQWQDDLMGEQDDRHHRWVWGSRAPLADLLGGPPGEDEHAPGETTRFGALACGLWAPALASEERG